VESFGDPDSDTFEGLDPDDASATSSETDGTSESAEIQASEARETPETREPIELGIDPTDPWTIAQAFVIYVGIAPVVEEFFFRGVLQQGAVARLGLVRGVGFVALLYTLFHLPAVPVASRFLMGALSSFGLGCLLGLVRAATGSILGPMLLASVWAAVGILAFALEERLPLQGMNVPGTHLPVLITLASGALVAWVAQTLYQEALRRSNDPPQEAAP
jgi:hypothetical protein